MTIRCLRTLTDSEDENMTFQKGDTYQAIDGDTATRKEAKEINQSLKNLRGKIAFWINENDPSVYIIDKTYLGKFFELA